MFWRHRKRIQPSRQVALVERGVYHVLPVNSLLALHGDIHRRLRAEVDFSPDHEELYFTHLVERLVRYVHGLPASQHGLYRQSAGLLGKCLRTAFLAQRIAHGLVVASHMPADARTLAERGWRYAAMIAGLIYPTGVLSQLGAQLIDSRRVWRPEYGPLMDWLAHHGETTYRPYWSTRDWPYRTPGSVRKWLASQLLTPGIVEFITRETDEYADQLLGVLGDELSPEDLMSHVIRRAYDEAVRQDLMSTLEDMRGLPVEDTSERLLNAVALVCRENVMKSDDSVLRCTEQGDYAIWPRFAQALRAAAVRHDILGLPEQDSEILELLGELGVILSNEAAGGYLYRIALDGRVRGMVVDAIRFRDLGEFGVTRTPETFAYAQILPPESSSRNGEDAEVQTQARDAASVEDVTPSNEAESGDDVVQTGGEPAMNVADNSSAEKGEDVPPSAKSDQALSARTAVWTHLGTLGRYLADAMAQSEELGWWTGRGRALPWPEVAVQAGVKPPQFLQALKESGVAVQSGRRQLPLIHEIVHEGQPRLAVIIETSAWPEETHG